MDSVQGMGTLELHMIELFLYNIMCDVVLLLLFQFL
jgi:hypothetical protein